MLLKVGDAIHIDLDVYFPVFSDISIQGYKKEGKLIAELAQALPHGGIKSSFYCQPVQHGHEIYQCKTSAL